ncbi:MAG: Carbohydrate binding domain protein [Lentisphaerae bacterium ADurb.Bin242]|nr:MAG: Carbohydrate binding domain protein [Lentisphaerae bacterium ADurb.Bin242]
MFKKSIVMIGATLLCGLAVAQSPQNLLLNGDFCNGMKSWLPHNENGVTIEEKVAPGGLNALKLVSAKEHYVANYSLKVKPDTDYTITAKIKTDGSAQVYLFFCRTPDADKYNTRSQVFTRSTDWIDVNIILNSGKAKEMPVICRVIGAGTAWFADIKVTEGNNMPVENLIKNSDFKTKTRYKSVPDGWTPAIQTPVATPDDYIFELTNQTPPINGAGVFKIANCLVSGQKVQQPVPGQVYTYSFYAKNVVSGSNTEIQIRFDNKSDRVKLSDKWTRYSLTSKLKTAWPATSVRAAAGSSFYFSAPQLVMGAQAQPWVPPKTEKSVVVTTIREAVAEAESRKISGKPNESDWTKAPAYPVAHITKGRQEALIPATARILHNDQFIFVLFESKTSPEIKVGNPTKIDWGNICDNVELFLTDTANDGTYIHYAVDVNGHSYSAYNMTPEILGITSEVAKKRDSWTACITVPLTLFKANRNWKIAFGRCYDHEKYGRIASDWSLPGSRHNTANFGLLRGVSVLPVPSLELEKLYGSMDRKKLFYGFSGFKNEMVGSSIDIRILLNGKTLWQTRQPFNGMTGEIELPADYEKMIETETRIALEVIGKNDQKYYQASRVLYLLFSSYARHNKAMEVYPKYNIFTEKDKYVELIVNMDKKIFDRLKVTLIDSNGKTAHSAETDSDLFLPSTRIADGMYKIKVEALKDGKIADVRCHESFMKLPFRQELVRMNRKMICLADAKGNFISMSYYSSGDHSYAYDPDYGPVNDALFIGAKKAGFNSVKKGFWLASQEKIDEWLAKAVKHDMPYLIDMSAVFPRGYYDGTFADNLSGPETEKIMVEYTRKLQKMTFGKPGILAYAPYHEPGYYRGGKGIIDSYRTAAILPEIKKNDPYRPITGFWAPPHWDTNGEPFGSVDGADFFIVDVYTRNLRKHCDELFRIAKASRIARRPLGQIFNIDNLGEDARECPTPAEYRAEVYTALIAGYRVFYNYIGIAPVRETWEEMIECNRRLPLFAKFICDDACRELASVNEQEVCYAVYERKNEFLIIAASKSNDTKTNLKIDLGKFTKTSLKECREFFDGNQVTMDGNVFTMELVPAGSGAWLFRK